MMGKRADFNPVVPVKTRCRSIQNKPIRSPLNLAKVENGAPTAFAGYIKMVISPATEWWARHPSASILTVSSVDLTRKIHKCKSHRRQNDLNYYSLIRRLQLIPQTILLFQSEEIGKGRPRESGRKLQTSRLLACTILLFKQ